MVQFWAVQQLLKAFVAVLDCKSDRAQSRQSLILMLVVVTENVKIDENFNQIIKIYTKSSTMCCGVL